MPTYRASNDCVVTCDGGGGCILDLDTSRCDGFCAGTNLSEDAAMSLAPESRVNVHLGDFPRVQLAAILSRYLGETVTYEDDGPVSLRLENVPVTEVLQQAGLRRG